MFYSSVSQMTGRDPVPGIKSKLEDYKMLWKK
jgi:hypothetical protein